MPEITLELSTTALEGKELWLSSRQHSQVGIVCCNFITLKASWTCRAHSPQSLKAVKCLRKMTVIHKTTRGSFFLKTLSQNGSLDKWQFILSHLESLVLACRQLNSKIINAYWCLRCQVLHRKLKELLLLLILQSFITVLLLVFMFWPLNTHQVAVWLSI